MIFHGEYKEFRNSETCSGCMYSKSENGEIGCDMTVENWKELESNETIDNLPCKGRGVSEDIQNPKEELVYQKSYQEYKAELDTELQKTSESFVKIGYLLKVAMETDILKESGYFNVNEFAKQEYDLDPTQVSRFININNRFSEDGNSPYLKEQYRGIGYAKLAIMLQLPESVNEEITPAFSKSEIQAIKDEVDAEKERTDIEVILEGEDKRQQDMDNNLQKALFKLLHDETEVYRNVYEELACRIGEDINEQIRALHEALAPSEESIYSVRIPGIGRLMLSVKGVERDITLTNLRSGEKESYTWQQVLERLKDMICGVNAEKSWEKIYDEKFPVAEKEVKEEVAPVQEKKKPAQRKQPKVTKAKEPESVVEQEESVSKNPESVPETEETVSKSVETVAKEPENITELTEIVTEEEKNKDIVSEKTGENSINIGNEGISEEHEAAGDPVIEKMAEELGDEVSRLTYMVRDKKWMAAKLKLVDISNMLESIITRTCEEEEDA